VTQQTRYDTTLSYVEHPVDIRSATGYPTVYQQASDIGGTFTRIKYGLPDQTVANFSPCLISHQGHRLITWRNQPEAFTFRHDSKYFYYNNTPTEVYVGELIGDETIIGAKKIREKPHRLSYEDPRLFVAPDDNLYLQFITSSYASKYDSSKHKMVNQPKVCVGRVDDFGKVVDCVYPPAGDNLAEGKPEKNWCFFSEDKSLRLLYSTIPLTIKTPGQPDKTIDSSSLKKVTGEYPTFNSTSPIKIGNEWLVFFHWKYMAYDSKHQISYLLYHLGAYTLDENFTKITRQCTEALFSGSTNDRLIWWTDVTGRPISKQPACVLPFGGIYNEENDEIELALGVNDSFMGIFKCPLVNILALLEPIEVGTDKIS
tara:strand:- start:1392 stop:2504 length:1113 start_codon:yes stop_codon:yes gene_type:complete